MKILYITSDFLFNIGGIYQHIENLTLYMSKKHEIIIIYLNKRNKSEVITDSYKRKVYFVANEGNKVKRFIDYPTGEIERIIKKESPDLIHIHTLFEAIRLKKHNIPTVFTNHSSSYLKMNKNFIMNKFILPKTMTKFKTVICPSTELYNETKSKDKLMISNGVNLERFDIKNREKFYKSDILSKYSINYSEQRILISTRRLFDKNGILDFVRHNVPFFKEKINEVIYIIVGDGEHFNDINTIIREHNLSNIYMLGSIDNNLIDELYYISDFSLIPSKMEAISISALESMACGCIVIANKVGGLAELIIDNINGKFLNNLSLKDCMEDKDFIKNINHIRKNAYDLVKNNYSWENISNKTEMLYKKLLVKSE